MPDENDQSAFSDLLDVIVADDRELVAELAQDLVDWLDRGGFSPGGHALRKDTIAAFCRFLAKQDS